MAPQIMPFTESRSLTEQVLYWLERQDAVRFLCGGVKMPKHLASYKSVYEFSHAEIPASGKVPEVQRQLGKAGKQEADGLCPWCELAPCETGRTDCGNFACITAKQEAQHLAEVVSIEDGRRR